MNQQICAAIKSKHHLVFNFDGLPREIEPHAHGISSTGKEVVRGFQTAGQSSSGPLGWRLWDVAKMKSLRVSAATANWGTFMSRPDALDHGGPMWA